jgi:LysR family transcriptional regulator for metE and metH
MAQDLGQRLTLTALRCVAAVAECGSVGKAAQALHVTQPALSYQIGQIASLLGAPVFDRTRAGMVPTPAGARLVRAARAVDREIDRAARDIRLLLSGGEGSLRISSECFTAYHWLPAVLRRFRREYPGVNVEIDVSSSRRPLEALTQGDLDVVLTTVPPETAGVSVTPLFDDEVVAILPPDHPFKSRRYLTPRDFADQSILVFSEEASDLFNLVLRPAGVRPRHVAEVKVTEAIVEMVKAGLGISALASWVVQPELEKGDLISVRVTRHGLRRSWSGITLPEGSAPPYVHRFLATLVASLAAPRIRRAGGSSPVPPRAAARRMQKEAGGNADARHGG